MIVDFALDAERQEGLTPEESIYQACLVRFRPIMMTTLAAMFGALPLAIGMGIYLSGARSTTAAKKEAGVACCRSSANWLAADV